MASENIPAKDALYKSWIATFASVATANATLLNLSTGQTTALTTASSDFTTAYNANRSAKANAKGKAAAKRTSRTSSEALFRATAKVITANPDISDDLKAELGLNVAPPPATPVVPVADLAVSGFANGDNKLVWKRNGNTKTTSFLIQAKYGSSNTWTLVAATNTIRYTHSGQTPGLQVIYRVISQRGGVQSSPSNEAIVYGSQEAEIITLPMAA